MRSAVPPAGRGGVGFCRRPQARRCRSRSRCVTLAQARHAGRRGLGSLSSRPGPGASQADALEAVRLPRTRDSVAYLLRNEPEPLFVFPALERRREGPALLLSTRKRQPRNGFRLCVLSSGAASSSRPRTCFRAKAEGCLIGERSRRTSSRWPQKSPPALAPHLRQRHEVVSGKSRGRRLFAA
jgi:hypothetical protein